MKEKERRASVGNIGVLLVFCALALCLLMTLLMGARIYRSVTLQAEHGSNRRSVSQYVANRIRQADSEGMVTVESFEGSSALVIRQTIDGRAYVTWIYCRDGWLWELFAAESSDLSAEAGEQLIPAKEMSFSLSEGLLTAQVTHSDGSSQTISLYLRSKEGSAP